MQALDREHFITNHNNSTM